MNHLERAVRVAVDAHEEQTDKAGATYIRHPLRLMEQMDTEHARVVAVLHDVVEDAEYTSEDIEKDFDTDVRKAVDALTKRDDESYMEFIERVDDHPVARRVKIADLEDNLDLTRLDELTDSIHSKQRTYHEAWKRLKKWNRGRRIVNSLAARYLVMVATDSPDEALDALPTVESCVWLCDARGTTVPYVLLSTPLTVTARVVASSP